MGLAGGVLRSSRLFRDQVIAAMTDSGVRPSLAALEHEETVMDFVTMLQGDGLSVHVSPAGGLAIEPREPLWRAGS